MFDGIARRYDLLNRLISFGVDRSWRQQTVDALAFDDVTTPRTVLDLATGTGDMAVTLTQRYPKVSVVGVDPSTGMMEVGAAKVRAKGLASRISFEVGDSQALTFNAAAFDGITMAFGIRNVPDRQQALREMVRVCKPGAKIAILELSEPQKGLVAAVGRFHMHRLVPLVGSLLSGSREYSYLPRSIAAFPAPDVFRDMMLDAGMRHVHLTPLTFGVCHLYVGEA
jgi:demethylmenaquinone methyltransferase / 2-methoxy-6-polyprenyl-1,4-benzoquinol methylase